MSSTLRISQLGFQPQWEDKFAIILNKIDNQDDLSLQLLGYIKYYLGHSALTLKLDQNTKFWTNRLNRYITVFGYRFSKEDHIAFIKTTYDIVCFVEGLDYQLTQSCVSLLNCLLRKKRLLTPAELELDWKALFRFFCRIFIKPPTKEKSFQFLKLKREIDTLVIFSKPYFAQSATQEIFDEFKVKLYPLYPSNTLSLKRTAEYLNLFLPTITPEGNSPKHEIWLPMLMSIWKANPTCQFEEHIMELIANYSQNHVGYIDWKPEMSFIYSRILASFEFPVKFKDADKVPTWGSIMTHSSALWIICTLGDDSSQEHFSKFIHVISPYFYSVNGGSWTRNLIQFYQNLVTYFIFRLRSEKKKKIGWALETPTNYKLTQKHIDLFFDSLFRQPFLSSSSLVDPIATLAALKPELAIPILIQEYDQSMQDICKPWKSSIALANIMSSSLVFVNSFEYGYPLGVTHVIPTLLKVLQNIKVHDWAQLLFSFKTIGAFLSKVPIVDSSVYATDGLTEEEAIVNSDTHLLEEIINILISKIFDFIDSSSYLQTRLDSETREFTAFDDNIMNIVDMIFSDVLPNMSKEMFDACLIRLKKYIFNDVKEIKVAGRYLGHIVKLFTKANPDVALDMLVPDLCKIICSSLNEDGTVKEDESMNAVSYYIFILGEIMLCERQGIGKYCNEILNLLEIVIRFESREEHRIVTGLLNKLFYTLVSKTVTVDRKYMVYSTNPIKDWGLKRDLNNVELICSRPGLDEVQLVSDLIKRIIWPSMEFIENVINKNEPSSRHEVERHLHIINSLTVISNYLPDINEPPLYEYETEITHMQLNGISKLDLISPTGQNLKKTVLCLMVKLFEKLSVCDEDNFNAFEIMIEIFCNVLIPSAHRNEQIKLEVLNKQYKNQVAYTYKYAIPFINGKIALIMAKLNFPKSYRLTDSISQAVNTLLKLSISCYSKVSGDATGAILGILVVCPDAIKLVIKFIEEELLANHGENSPEYKGILNMLAVCGGQLLKHKEVVTSSKIWSLLLGVEVPESDRNVNIFSNITKCIDDNYGLYHWNLKVPIEPISSAHLLWNTPAKLWNPHPPSIEDINASTKNITEQAHEFESNYTNLIDSLLQHTTLHWRFEVLRLVFLRKLALQGVQYPSIVLQHILNKLLDPMLKVRQEAIITFGLAVKQLKQLPEPTLDTREYLQLNGDIEAWSFGENKINDILQYQNNNTNSKLVHKVYEGYTCWSSRIQNPLRPYVPNHAIINHFTIENIQEFYKLLCCHPPGDNSFCRENLHFFKHLFRNARSHIAPFVEQLNVASNEPTDQFIAAEIISGSLESVKYWEKEIQDQIWAVTLPVIKSAVENITPSIDYWAECFRRCTRNCDPKLMKKLFDYLSSWDLSQDSELSTITQKKMYFLTCAMSPVCWKIAALNNRILTKVIPFLGHKYQTFRNNIAALLLTVFIPDIEYDGERHTRSPLGENFITDVVLPFFDIFNLPLKPASQENEELQKICKLVLKTVCQWFITVGKSPQSLWIETYTVLPTMCQLGRNDPNSETAFLCTNALNVLAKNTLKLNDFQLIFDQLCTIYDKFKDNVHNNYCKTSLLQYTQVFIFYNLPHLVGDSTRIEQINDIVLNLMFDPDMEIKQAAKSLLRDFIKCKISMEVPDLIERYACESAFPHNNSLQHGRILILLAIIEANPYEVPDYLTLIFEILSNHLNDPHPIPSWIAASVDSFRHTQPDKDLLKERVPSELLQILSSSKLTYFS